jgi:hypothetical protein
MNLRPMTALAAFLLFSSAAYAGAAEELIAAIDKCAAIAEDASRHACYDQLPTLAKSLAPVAAAETQTAAASPPAAQPPDEEEGSLTDIFDIFGSAPVPAVHIAATVESFTVSFGLFEVTLDNGQVWRQVAASRELVRFSRDKKDQVKIWRSRFGYYVLKINDYPDLFHVRRIK